MGTGLELYVYYRVPADQASAAGLEVDATQQALKRRWPGLHARRLQRVPIGPAGPATDERAPLTWMEIYSHPDGLDPLRLAALIEATAALPSARLGDRHLEGFGR